MELGITCIGNNHYAGARQFARRVYKERHAVRTDANADAFAYLSNGQMLLGVFGLYFGHLHNPLLIETFFPDAFASSRDRHQFGELGTRAVDVPPHQTLTSGTVSLYLSAHLITFAHDHGLRHLGFTTNPSVRHIAKALDFPLTAFGKADLSRHDAAFRSNWEPFFRVDQCGFTIPVDSVAGCMRVLGEAVQKHAITIKP